MQSLKLIIVLVQAGAVKLYVGAAAAEALKEKGKTGPKLVEKLVGVPVILFCKIFIPSYTFDAILCEN